MASRDEINLQDIQALAEFRYRIRQFLRASEDISKKACLKPQQYQLMLHIKGLPAGLQASINHIAERLQIQHHSAVELADRLSDKGLVRRKRVGDDQRLVLLELTAKGERVLRELALYHREELRSNGAGLVFALKKVLSGVRK